jgi:catechol 2,3-dioxygenase-like lactoylglutathione lyase family enzyme
MSTVLTTGLAEGRKGLSRPFGVPTVSCERHRDLGRWRQTATITVEETTMSTSRVQLALNVTDVEEATRFYRDLFGVEPAKRRAGYANFAITDPPLKLVLFENPTATSALNHLGVEIASTEDVAAAAARFAAVGLATTMSSGERCCHAVQDKVWVNAPDVPHGGWEFYTVLSDDPGPSDDDTVGCCTSAPVSLAGECCATT